ncbi:hypothetical protein K491DRAFT_461949 [Lophiostoma macrostomum CBS 122681]|uniref:Stress-response A/B barrel domain-containing protein n=1 Tax=Lophiostoma macrostomum CBS 122681 TaxID=1314788 RepID=A0A6A6T5V1_9PLEO|nr:hypothetical protein K491DRAFT_461949 [Lophiostoma macrostomum CBS 122681]
MSSTPVTRVVLFNIPEKEDQEKLFDFYRTLKQVALKDGKPYILSASAGSTFNDPRNRGFTVAAVTKFSSEEDMKYYDDECPSHAKLKEFAKSVRKEVLMAYFEDVLA